MLTVVTGATGHVGTNLIRKLVEQGRIVRALVHTGQEGLDGVNVEVVKGDICDINSLCRAFQGADIVYHLATYISLLKDDWDKCELINVIGTRNVVHACLHCGVKRLIHFSSIHAHDQEPKTTPVDETRLLIQGKKGSPYDCSKADGEHEVYRGIKKGLSAVIINPTGIIGPYDYRPSHFGEVLISLAQGKMPVLIKGGFDWVDVRDVIDGAMKAEISAPNESKYILSGHWSSLKDIANIIAQIKNVSAPYLEIPLQVASAIVPLATKVAKMMGKRPLFTEVSLIALDSNKHIGHDKATVDLGYNPRPLEVTIKDTIRWFEESGRIK